MNARPTRSNAVRIPRIDPREPLPGYRPPEGRWFTPFRTDADGGVWRCNLRVPLTRAQRAAGLLSIVVAADEATLRALMAHEDERAARLRADALPTERADD